MQYIPFARKYRPSNFSELQGQDVLVKVLNYSISHNKLAGAYLLTGTRGIGKTTSARIIAKTINCTAQTQVGQYLIPCNNCDNCIGFNKEAHPDIIEIDAASKTGVDDIREIIDNSEYKPLLGKYKVFIIDEVHMLSKNAFNALLKILEEPPVYVIFIFATTEPQKIPVTVISRCQRYDLKRLDLEEIIVLLKKIAVAENIEYEDDAIMAISASSEGSAREAVSLLDQAFSMSAGALITAKLVHQILGKLSLPEVLKFISFVIDKDATQAVEFLDSAKDSWIQFENFMEDAIELIGYLNKIKILKDYKDQKYSALETEILSLSNRTNIAQVSVLWQMFTKTLLELKNSHNQILTLQMLVIKATYAQMLPDFDGISSEDNIELESALHLKLQDFLKYLRSHDEMEVYYFLLNTSEVKKFENGVMEIASPSVGNNLKGKITECLLSWTNEKWNVIIIESMKVISLKDEMINNIKSSPDWRKIVEHFPEATITDLLLKV